MEDAALRELRDMIRAQQEKLAQQELRIADQDQRLSDMNHKMLAAKADGPVKAANVTSLRKNAAVTIGGLLNTRYLYRKADFRSTQQLVNGGVAQGPAGYHKREDWRQGDMRITDAKLEFTMTVNDHLDAYIKLDLHDGAGRSNVSGVAQNYWVQWKRICDTGFGVLAGRDAMKFGDQQPIGVLDSWSKDVNASFEGDLPSWFAGAETNVGDGMFAGGNLLPYHTTYNCLRTTQVTPYWESHDGTFRAELSFIQALDRMNGVVGETNVDRNGNYPKYRSINYGAGSGTLRLIWKPVEGLKLTASAMNLNTRNDVYQGAPRPLGNKGDGAWTYYGVDTASNNSAVNFAFQYRPSFFKHLNLWAQWTHGWNEAWIKNMDSDIVQAGFSYDLTSRITVFAMGDYLRVKNSQSDTWNKATGWSGYFGVVYNFGGGLALEGGYRRDRIDFKDRAGGRQGRLSADVIYSNIQFTF